MVAYDNNNDKVYRAKSCAETKHIDAHTGTHTHKYIDYIQFTNRKQTGTLWRNIAALRRKHGRSIVLEKEMFEVSFKPVKRFLLERKGTASPCTGTKDRNGAGTSSGKSATKNRCRNQQWKVCYKESECLRRSRRKCRFLLVPVTSKDSRGSCWLETALT